MPSPSSPGKPRGSILLFVLSAACAAPAAADELRWDARTLFEQAVGRQVRLADDGTAVELAWGELFEDDGPAAGYSYQPNEERLSPGIRIRKELIIPNPGAAKATLLVGPGGDLQCRINGRTAELQSAGKADQYWQAYSFPPELLTSGRNEIVLSGSGKVWIARDDEFAAGSRTRTRHPNRSAKSTDDGRTWDDRRLGTNGDVDGEYYVRVFLDQHHAAGSLLSPVIDASNLTGRVVSPPVTSIGPLRIAVDAESAPETQITLQVRSGSTYVPDDEHWSDWHERPAGGGTLERPAGRFLQVRLDLATDDPLRSPCIRRLTVQSDPQRPADWTERMRVVEHDNPEIVRTAVPFEYEPFDHPRLKQLREQHRLDDVVAGAEREFDLITRLAAWSSRQWERGHLREAYPPWDALHILKPHADGTPVGGFCHQYHIVFLQACESFGLVGRAVSLGPGGLGDKPRRGGHEVAEIWSNDYGKWVYVDGQFAWYAVDEQNAVPLSLWELRQRQLATLQGRPTPATRVVTIAETGRESWRRLDEGIPFGELRLVPRSNFLEQASPLPLNQGMRGWFWTGHAVWSDKHLPAALLYGRRVTRRGDFEWTLNQARIVLEAAETPRLLRIHLDTETPGFDTFLASIDSGEARPVRSRFEWKLHSGRNCLEVRTRNVAGRVGMTSRIVLE